MLLWRSIPRAQARPAAHQLPWEPEGTGLSGRTPSLLPRLFSPPRSRTGQVSVQRAILEVQKYRSQYKESVDGFIEEAVVRRELADNFCFYNRNYDKVEGNAWPAPWGSDSLRYSLCARARWCVGSDWGWGKASPASAQTCWRDWSLQTSGSVTQLQSPFLREPGSPGYVLSSPTVMF